MTQWALIAYDKITIKCYKHLNSELSVFNYGKLLSAFQLSRQMPVNCQKTTIWWKNTTIWSQKRRFPFKKSTCSLSPVLNSVFSLQIFIDCSQFPYFCSFVSDFVHSIARECDMVRLNFINLLCFCRLSDKAAGWFIVQRFMCVQTAGNQSFETIFGGKKYENCIVWTGDDALLELASSKRAAC